MLFVILRTFLYRGLLYGSFTIFCSYHGSHCLHSLENSSDSSLTYSFTWISLFVVNSLLDPPVYTFCVISSWIVAIHVRVKLFFRNFVRVFYILSGNYFQQSLLPLVCCHIITRNDANGFCKIALLSHLSSLRIWVPGLLWPLTDPSFPCLLQYWHNRIFDC